MHWQSQGITNGLEQCGNATWRGGSCYQAHDREGDAGMQAGPACLLCVDGQLAGAPVRQLAASLCPGGFVKGKQKHIDERVGHAIPLNTADPLREQR